MIGKVADIAVMTKGHMEADGEEVSFLSLFRVLSIGIRRVKVTVIADIVSGSHPAWSTTHCLPNTVHDRLHSFRKHRGRLETVHNLERVLDPGLDIRDGEVEPLVMMPDLVDVRAQYQLIMVLGNLCSSPQVTGLKATVKDQMIDRLVQDSNPGTLR